MNICKLVLSIVSIAPVAVVLPSCSELTGGGRHFGPVTDIAVAADGKTSVSSGEDGRLILRSIARDITTRQVFTLGPSPIYSVAYSPDGKTIGVLSSAGPESTVSLIDSTTGALRASVKLQDQGWCLRASPLGDHWAMSGDGVRLWDAALRSLTARMTEQLGTIFSVAFSPDGRKLATGGSDGKAFVWDIATGNKLLELDGQFGWVRSVAFASDGDTLAAGAFDDFAMATRQSPLSKVVVWDLHSGTIKREMSMNSRLRKIAFHPSERILAIGLDDGALQLWGITSGQPAISIKTSRPFVNAMAFTPDGASILIGFMDGQVEQLDVNHSIKTLAASP